MLSGALPAFRAAWYALARILDSALNDRHPNVTRERDIPWAGRPRSADQNAGRPPTELAVGGLPTFCILGDSPYQATGWHYPKLVSLPSHLRDTYPICLSNQSQIAVILQSAAE